jgi:hypothetical protein
MPSPFYEEWRACLRSHYQYVIQNNDLVTEPTLRGVMIETGFTEADLSQLRYELAGEVPEIAAIADVIEPAEPVETVDAIEPVTAAPEVIDAAEMTIPDQAPHPAPEPVELAQPETPVAVIVEQPAPEAPEPPPPVKPAKPTVQLSLF